MFGRITRSILENKNLPIDSYSFFASYRSAGEQISFKGQKYVVEELTEQTFVNKKIDYAIFTAGKEAAKKYAPIAAKNNCTVIDNSSYFRMDKSVPLVVPEINFNTIKEHQRIIANPNCSTIQEVMAIYPIYRKYKIKRIVCSTYQAVSGAGLNGIEDLQNGIDSYVYSSDNKPNKFSCRIFNNCIPHIDEFTVDGYTKEEHKIIDETKKILNDDSIKITATAVRIPVFNCHSESINIELEEDFDIEDIKELLSNSKGVVVKDDIVNKIYPTVIDANNSNDVYVGRIRRDYSVRYGINMWVVADNLRKGAGGNAVEILEELINKTV